MPKDASVFDLTELTKYTMMTDSAINQTKIDAYDPDLLTRKGPGKESLSKSQQFENSENQNRNVFGMTEQKYKDSKLAAGLTKDKPSYPFDDTIQQAHSESQHQRNEVGPRPEEHSFNVSDKHPPVDHATDSVAATFQPGEEFEQISEKQPRFDKEKEQIADYLYGERQNPGGKHIHNKGNPKKRGQLMHAHERDVTERGFHTGDFEEKLEAKEDSTDGENSE